MFKIYVTYIMYIKHNVNHRYYIIYILCLNEDIIFNV